MLPKYTYFKLHDPAAHKYNSSLEYSCDLVKRQITLRKSNINRLNLAPHNTTVQTLFLQSSNVHTKVTSLL